MAEIDKSTVLASDLLSVKEFVERLEQPGVTTESIRYHYGLRPGDPDNLDVVKIGRDRFIVYNDRAKNFKIGQNYWTRRTSWGVRKTKPEEPEEIIKAG